MATKDAKIRVSFEAGDRAGLDQIKLATQSYQELEQAILKADRARSQFASAAHREEFAARMPSVAQTPSASPGVFSRALTMLLGMKGFAEGGSVPGSGSGDTVPAWLTPGEFIMRKEAVRMFGAANLAAMNRAGAVRRFSQGGFVFGVGMAGGSSAPLAGGAMGAPTYGSPIYATGASPPPQPNPFGFANTHAQAGDSLARLAGAATLAYGAFNGLIGSVRSATTILDARSNTMLSGGQQVDTGIRSIPIVGSVWGAGVDMGRALVGSSERMRQTARQHILGSARIQMQAQGEMAMMPDRWRSIEAGSQAWAAQTFRHGPPVPVGAFDRSTLAGQIGFGEAHTRHQADRGITAAMRAYEAARLANRLQGTRVDDARANMDATEARRADAQRRYERVRDRPGIADTAPELLEAATRAQRANQEAVAAAAIHHREIVQLQQTETAEARTQAAVGQSRIAQLQAEQQLLQQREQRMVGTANRLGRLNPGQRMAGEQALAFIRATGNLDNVPDQSIELARSIDATYIGRLEQERGERYGQQRGAAGDEETFEFRNNTIAGTRRAQEAIQMRVEQTSNIDEEQLATRLADIANRHVNRQIESLEIRIERRLNEITAGMQTQSASQ